MTLPKDRAAYHAQISLLSTVRLMLTKGLPMRHGDLEVGIGTMNILHSNYVRVVRVERY